MELIKQVTSLEIARKLKELGVKQDSLFWWCAAKANGVAHIYKVYSQQLNNKNENYSAFTVAELGEIMKTLKYEHDAHTEWNYVWKKWTCFLYDMNCEVEWQLDESTEAAARGAMLIYLIENKLITT